MWRGGAYFAVAQKDCLRFESGGGGDVFFLLKYKQRCRVDFEFPMYKSTKMKDFNFKGVWVVRYNRNLVDNYFEKTFKIKYQKYLIHFSIALSNRKTDFKI